MNSFDKRKKDVLEKLDKSNKGNWDEKILNLCGRINKKEDYYTTSSCSGRVVLFRDKEKKGPNVFVKVYHELIIPKNFLNEINEISTKEKKIILKLEPCILHIACRDLKSANLIIEKAKLAGWKKRGIISFDRRVIVELNGTERLEFPLILNKKLLVDENFLEIVVTESNKKLKKSWNKIKKLEKFLIKI